MAILCVSDGALTCHSRTVKKHYKNIPNSKNIGIGIQKRNKRKNLLFPHLGHANVNTFAKY